MLTHLHIENLMLIEQASVSLEANFIAITGESGSGKSSLMEALKLALGTKTSSELLRRGQAQATVRASFDLSEIDMITHKRLQTLFEQSGLTYEPQEPLIIQRRLHATKPSKAFIGQAPVTLQTLLLIGQELVEIVDAGSSFALNNLEAHLDCLDAFAGLHELRQNCEQAWHDLKAANQELERLHQLVATSERQRPLLEYQIDEIEQANLHPNEEKELFEEFRRLSSAEDNSHLLSQIDAELSQPNFQKLGKFINQLARLQGSWPAIDHLIECLNACLINAQEAQIQLASLSLEMQQDPQRLDSLQKRLDLIQLLKKKYGASQELIQQFYDQSRLSLQEIDHAQEKIACMNQKRAELESAFNMLCQSLNQSRSLICPELCDQVNSLLHQLNMPHAKFSVQMAAKDSGPTGCDHVEFFIQPNPGEPTLSVRKSASAGEMARLFLALKTLKAHRRIPPTLIFDEIDASIGGQSAAKLASKLDSLSQSRQVICITHFPQVAEQAKQHLVIEKAVQEGRTHALVRHAKDKKQRQEEIQRMLGKDKKSSNKHELGVLS